MGTELVRACIKEDDFDFPTVPPGFERYTPFKLKKEENTETDISYSVVPKSSQQEPHTEVGPNENDSRKITRALKRRQMTDNGQCCDSNDGSVLQNTAIKNSSALQNTAIKNSLPKGVIRGCAECINCQKVVARYKPEAACRPKIEEAPVFYPTEEEFKDTISYIGKIRPEAEPYGICRIVPPSSWKPPCPLKKKTIWENSKFVTRVQRVDKLQNREPANKTYSNHMSKKRRRCSRMGTDSEAEKGNMLAPLEFGFEPGPEFTLDAFQRYANQFKAHYFRDLASNISTEAAVSPSIEVIEGEYWRVVENPSEEIEVLYGADLETGAFGSGFPKTIEQVCSTDEEYVKSGWNLNNLPRVPGSVLTYESTDISGVQVPWLYVGMCFSSFCWHVEDHYLYSLNYMHFGAPKLWYGVPGKDATKLEEAMRKHLSDLFDEQPDLLHKLVTQLSPSILKSEGVPVYRCVQSPGEFVITFPRAYHGGFNCGFNCAEAVNVAPLDWFPHGQNAVELYREQRRKTTISHDKLLVGAAIEAVKANWELNFLKKNTADNLKWKNVCGDGILAKSLKTRVDMEHERRDIFSKSSHILKMVSSFDATTERECSVCFFDLHLSAVGCRCSPDTYACLNHAKQMCPCDGCDKYFLFRYENDELDLLVEAIQGKLSAVYRFAKSYLGLSLTTHISKDNKKEEAEIQPPKQAAPPRVTFVISKKSTVVEKNTKEGVLTTSHKFKIKKDVMKSSTPTIAAATEVKKSSVEHDVICLSDDDDDDPKSATKPVQQPKVDQINTNDHQPTQSTKSRDIVLALSVQQQSTKRKDPTPPVHKKVVAGVARTGFDSSQNRMGTRSSNQKGPKIVKVVHNKVVADVAKTSLDSSQNSVETRSVNQKGPQTAKVVHNEVVADVAKAGLDSSQSRVETRSNNQKGAQIAKVVHNEVVVDVAKTGVDSSQNSVETRSNNQKGAQIAKVVHNEVVADVAKTGLDSSPNSVETRSNNQKGPRIAKVVRRINCNVEPLEFGSVVPGKLWSSSRTIFPKGFKSRVKYINVLDPTNMCHYISQVLDSGAKGPLFMASLEDNPSEVFVHITPTRCWEMVRERVNNEISKQHKLGKLKLPPLQPPGSSDGFELFGFTSPPIIQAIETLDGNRVCVDYWKSRPHGRLQPAENLQTPLISKEAKPVEADKILSGLFKKASSEELRTLLAILGDDKSAADVSIVTSLLRDEIRRGDR